jgi:hypothetical protein
VRLQRLFGNDYTPPRRVSPGHRMARRTLPRTRIPVPWRTAALVSGPLVLLLLVGPGLASAGMPAPYSASSLGGVEVTVPSLYPQVEISQVGNATIASTLALDQFLEATPGGAAPSVVAVALPSNISATNASGGFPVRLTADLTVYPSSAPLWSGPNDLVQPDGAPLGTAQLWVNYSLGDPADSAQGVTVNWSVADWPWLSSSDLLGVQLSVATPSATSVVACTGALSTVGTPGCPGSTAPSSAAGWLPRAAALQAAFPGGPSALLHWPSGFALPGGASATVSVGVIASTPSTGHVIVAAPADGASRVSSGLAFSLLPPVVALPAPLLVRGELGPYVAGALASVAAGLAGVLLYRRRAAAIERAL